MYLRRYAHDANVPLSLRSPISVATNRSADAYRRICFIEDSWGNHTFLDLFPAFSRCLLLTGGSSSIPPLLYPRLLFLRCLKLRFRDEVVCRVPGCPLLGSSSYSTQTASIQPLTVPGSISSCLFIVRRCVYSWCIPLVNSDIPVGIGRTLLRCTSFVPTAHSFLQHWASTDR